MANDRYFAAAPKEQIGNSIAGRLESYRQTRDATRDQMLCIARSAYYGYENGAGTTYNVRAGGAGGQLAVLRVNKARAAAQSLLGLITSAPMAWKPQAPNTDAAARGAVTIASGLLEHYWKREGMERDCLSWVEKAIVLSEADVFIEWDETKGPELPDGENIMQGGDITLHVLSPWDTARDETVASAQDSQWTAVRVLKNKWDLISMHPETITGQSTKDVIGSGTDLFGFRQSWLPNNRMEADNVPVYWFFHRPSPTLPMGREVCLTSGSCVLIDRPLSYPEIPVYRLAQSDLFDVPHGYSNWWDTLAAQGVIDGLETAIATNQLTLATQSVAMVEGTKQAPDDLSGMKAWYYPRGEQPPTPLSLTSTPKEVFEHRAELMADQRDLIGLNDVSQGQPDTAQMNGAAFALLASMAVQRNAPFQKAYISALSRLGMGLLKVLRAKVDTERQVAIVGKANQYLFTSKPFHGAMLQPIASLVVEIGSAVEQSTAGRWELGQLYVTNGWAKSPEELEQVLDTGRLDPLLQGERSNLLLVAAENEMLSGGEMPLVHNTQDHLCHVKEHAYALNANPENQNNQELLGIFQEHIAEHYREYWGIPDGIPLPEGDPEFHLRIRVMLGQIPPQSIGLQPVAPPPGEALPPPGGGPLAPEDPGAVVEAQLPEPAADPLTGEPAGPPLPLPPGAPQ